MYLIQQTQLSQVNSVAICHQFCFPSSFAAKLGMSYNKKTLEWFLAGNNRFLFHVLDNERVIGYCGGFQSTGLGDGSTSGMMQYAMKEAAMGMLRKPWLFFNKDVLKFYPLIVKNIFKKITAKKNKIVAASNTANKINVIGLVVIGVHPDERGKGCFELLMRHFEEICRQRGAAKMTLSVKASNKRAIAAYKKAGWLISNQTSQAIEMHKAVSA